MSRYNHLSFHLPVSNIFFKKVIFFSTKIQLARRIQLIEQIFNGWKLV